MAKLTDPITILRGIGPAKAKLFHALNIFTLEDLICHFPRSYEDRTKLVNVCDLEVDKPACFRAWAPALATACWTWSTPSWK